VIGVPEELTVLSLRRKPDFVDTPYVRSLCERAGFYAQAGYPVHFSGPAGTGKTTLAMHVAAELGRPVMLVHGDDEFGSSDLIGGQLGYRASRVVDNFIHSVVKTEENVSKVWMDNRITTACKFGLTLIYDEFNRSRPEANNVLLGVLEERLLELPTSRSGDGYLQVHPEFRAIFTSNPEEYAGVHKTQDALLDRMITIKLGHYDPDTETSITAAKSGLPLDDARRVVALVRSFRTMGVNHYRPTIRACIMIARLTALRNARATAEDSTFREVCRDVLCCDTIKITHDGESVGEDRLEQLIQQACAISDPSVEAPDEAPAETPVKSAKVSVRGGSPANGHRKRKSAAARVASTPPEAGLFAQDGEVGRDTLSAVEKEPEGSL
jgi:nitric oxide reductase NorQ protein